MAHGGMHRILSNSNTKDPYRDQASAITNSHRAVSGAG